VDYFHYRFGELYCEEVPAAELAGRFGTPLYVYSAATVLDHFRKIRQAFGQPDMLPHPPLVCYSVKANPCLTLLALLRDEGAGFDVVSGGELHRALAVGADPSRIVFAGVGKTDEELRAAAEQRLLLVNVESESELRRLDAVVRERGLPPASVALRVNPDVDPKTHTYITTGKRENKFGVDLERARELVRKAPALPGVRLKGLHVHIGSQITSPDPYVETLRRLLPFVDECRRMAFPVDYLDIGGGFGIWYKERLARTAREMADALLPLVVETGCRLILEPGRFICGNAGVLLTRVLVVKDLGDRRIAVCDTGMHHLIRPALYNAYHRIWPVRTDPGHNGPAPDEEKWEGDKVLTDVVGPICETGDFLARERWLPRVEEGDLLAIFSAGAYGAAMASNYNSHGRPAEVVVLGSRAEAAVRRETIEDLLAREQIVPLKERD
jgi:diaminopimelate decarboxylase